MNARKVAATMAGVLFLDQLTKWLLKDANVVLLPGILKLHGVRNEGAAFGMLSGRTWLLAVIGISVVALLLWYLLKEKPRGLFAWGLTLVAAGAVGNLVDRVLYGYVVDFVELLFVRFAIFNVSDIAVTIGCVLAALGLLQKENTHA